MKQVFKISGKVILILIGICLVLWSGILLFVHYNKKTFANIITRQMNDNISGKVSIGSIDLTFFKGFPDVSFELKDLSLRDSLYHMHKKEILNVKRAYATISLSSVFKGEDAYVDKLTLEDGNVHLYTGPDGISNTRIFRKKDKKKKEKKDNSNPLANVEINNVLLTIRNHVKKKDFIFDIRTCHIRVLPTDSGWNATLETETLVKHFMFNTDKGSFIENTNLVTTLQLYFSELSNNLNIPPQTLLLNDAPYQFGGTFTFADTPYRFNLDIKGVEVEYKRALATLTPAIQEKFKDIYVDKVDTVGVKIIGKMRYLDTPYVKASFEVKNRDVTIPAGVLSKSTFKGFFMNEYIEGKGHGNPNSMVYVDKLTANYYGIDIMAKEVTVYDMLDPVLKAQIISDFELKKLNDLIGVNTFRFTKGTAGVNLSIVAGLKSNYIKPPAINGYVRFDKAGFTYAPRNLAFSGVSGMIGFNGADVNIKNVALQSGKNSIALNGNVNNLLNLYYSAPDKVVIAANIRSNKINLDDYVSLIGERTKTAKTAQAPANTSAKLRRFAKQLDALMENSVAKINLNVNEVNYKKFTAEDIKAGLTITQSDIHLHDVRLKHADGIMTLDADVKPNNKVNKVTLKAGLEQVNVHKLFTAFDNFGQTALLDKNVQGKVSAHINVTGGIQYSGAMVPKSLNGKVDFTLDDGRLVDFEPLGTIAKIIFFNRDLSDIKIEKLTNTFDINNGNIRINPMLIQTSVINIFAEGVYGIPTGTDILIQVPLRNPKKDLNKNNEDMTEQDLKKGMVINLRATDENTGKVKIKLGKKKAKEGKN